MSAGMLRIWVYKRRFWWSALNPDEPLALMDTHRYFRAFSRERAIEKCRRAFSVGKPDYEEVRFPVSSDPPEPDHEQ